MDDFAEQITMRMDLVLSARHSTDIAQGIKEELSKTLMKYNRQLGGVPLSYSNVVVKERAAAISTLTADLSLWVEVTLSAFLPKPGMVLTGTVNRASVDHIGILVGGAFNASVSSLETPPSLYFDDNEDCWLHENDQSMWIAEGQRIRFSVVSVDASADVLQINGSIKTVPDIIIDPTLKFGVTTAAATALTDDPEVASQGDLLGKRKRAAEESAEDADDPPTKKQQVLGDGDDDSSEAGAGATEAEAEGEAVVAAMSVEGESEGKKKKSKDKDKKKSKDKDKKKKKKKKKDK